MRHCSRQKGDETAKSIEFCEIDQVVAVRSIEFCEMDRVLRDWPSSVRESSYH